MVGKVNKYEYLTGEEILHSDQRRVIEQVNFNDTPLRKALEKQTKTIEYQVEKQIQPPEKHGKQQIMSSSKRDSLELLKQE